jgi:hypothetical protein
VRTNASPRLTLLRGGGGEVKNGSASTIFGPVRAGLTTSHRTQHQALSELLNDLESGIADLESRYFTVLDIYTGDILPRVGRLCSITGTDITRI